jgi:hypothetical protein
LYPKRTKDLSIITDIREVRVLELVTTVSFIF